MVTPRLFPRGIVPHLIIALAVALAIASGVDVVAARQVEPRVTKTEDSNDGVCDDDCSLREAIAAASPGDTINIPPGTYILTEGSGLTVDKDLTLSGAGADGTIIQSGLRVDVSEHRVFKISAGVVAISDLTVSQGGGGAIWNLSTLTLTQARILDNNSPGSVGGGIKNEGTLTAVDVLIAGNTALSGGGISNSGTLFLTNGTVQNNVATASGGGIANGGSLTLSASTVVNNSVSIDGGVSATQVP